MGKGSAEEKGRKEKESREREADPVRFLCSTILMSLLWNIKTSFVGDVRNCFSLQSLKST
jgi:hypothetical protein